MREGYDVKVEGGACALKRTESGIFKDNLGWISAAVCPGGGDLELCLRTTQRPESRRFPVSRNKGRAQPVKEATPPGGKKREKQRIL